MLQALNAWLRRSWVWCLVTGCQLSSGRTQPSVWRRFSRPIRCLGRGAIRRKHRAVSACSVFWFLAPWVALVQSIGSRHSALGAAINCRAAPASNQSQQFVAYGHRTPLSGRRCASALNAWLRRSWVWCLVTGCQLSSGRTQPSVWRRFSRPIRCLGRGAIRRIHWSASVHSVFWFLAPWIKLVHSTGSGHSTLGAQISNRVSGP